MLKTAVLVITIWCQATTCRRLSNTLDNNVGSSSNRIFRSDNWVKITEAPTPVINRQIGERIELVCVATGSPAPTIQWLKGNTPLTENKSFETNALFEMPISGMAKVKARLVIPSILSNQEDVYTCVAESGSEVATAKTRIFLQNSERISDTTVTVRQPARIVLFDIMYMGDMGTSVVLPCKTVGNPRPNIVWVDPSEEVLENGHNPRITVHSNGDLLIRNIQWKDMGPYTCMARNDLAEDTITTFLYPMLPRK